MGLPTSRSETCTPAGMVRSALMNEIQDAIVGSKHTWQWRWYPFPVGVQVVNVDYNTVAAGSVFPGCIRANGGVGPYGYKGPVHLGLPEGTLIDGFKMSVTGAAGGGNVTLLLASDGVAIASLTEPNPGAGVTVEYTSDPILTPTILANHVFTLDAVFPAQNVIINKFAIRAARL